MIYIPIWLDLLQGRFYIESTSRAIYIPIWLDLLLNAILTALGSAIAFTFQYGQIYYHQTFRRSLERNRIYIPIWLDLLSTSLPKQVLGEPNLHSNMVRFIIYKLYITIQLEKKFTFQYGQIYYTAKTKQEALDAADLHSNMVRFIIMIYSKICQCHKGFTFQYGQIYYV